MNFRRYCATLILAAAFAAAQTTGDPSHRADLTDRVGRLEMLADLWGKLWLFHSSIVTSDVDWDQTLVDVIPKVEEAQDADALIAVLNENLFPRLNDPALVAYRPSSVKPAEARPLSARRLSETVGYVDATDPRQHSQRDYAQRFEELVAGLGGVRTLVVDLRCSYASEEDPRAPYTLLNTAWFGVFTDHPLRVSLYARRKHEGWNPDNRPDFPYHQSWELESVPRSQHPVAFYPRSPRFPGQVLILVNNATYRVLQPVLDALRESGAVAVAWEQTGPFPRVGPAGGTAVLDYGGFEVAFQGPALVSQSGGLGLRPDFVSADAIEEQAILEMAAQLPRPVAERSPFTGQMQFPTPDPEVDQELSREQRLLGLFKIWIVTKYFFPHLEFASIDWDTALREWIPQVEAATTREYFRDVLARLVARLNDSHVYVESRFGGVNGLNPWKPPVLVWPVEDKFVVVAVEQWDHAVDIAPGDEILAIDGKPVSEVKQHYHDLVSNSSYQSEQRLWRSSLQGPEGVPVQLTLSRDGRTWTISVPRDRPWDAPQSFRTYKQVESQQFPDGVGYINISGIRDGAVLDQAFEDLRSSRGLIFDLREPNINLPHSYQWFFDRLAQKPSADFIVEISEVTSYDGWPWVRRATQMRAPSENANPYTGPVVVLMGSWLQSAWEGIESMLKEIDNVTLVGAITPGTNGNITQVPLPGGATFTFTGMRILNPDGSRFQNIGIIPDVEVYPTVEGIREGRDEVLEKGIEVLRRLIAESSDAGK